MIDSMMVVGDVHGSYDQLARLLDSPYATGRHVVFIGDLIDRGPNSAGVLDLLDSLTKEWVSGTTVLRGNHEEALLNFLRTGDAGTFLRNGGIATISSYHRSAPRNVLGVFRESFPERHLALLRNSQTHLETDQFLVSHMGYDPQQPYSRDLRAMVLEPHPGLFRDPAIPPVPLTVCGHYAQMDGLAYSSEALICIDAGCGTIAGSPLAAVLLPERKIVYSDVEGRVK